MKLFLFFLISFSFINVKAQTPPQKQCAELFQNLEPNEDISFDHLFPSIKNDYPILSRIITNKFYVRSDRIRNDPEWKQLQDLIKDCSTAACSIQLNSDIFSFSGEVQITKEADAFVLNISIDHFIAANVKPVGKKKMMRYIERVQSTNVQFLNLMSILFSSVYYALQNNPDISIVRITGKSVVNNNLAKVLEDMGFQPGEKDPLTLMNILGATSLMASIPKIAEIHSKGIHNTNIKIFGGGKAFLITGFGVYELFFNKNRTVPRNWILELKL